MKAFIRISCWLLLLVCIACTEEQGKFLSSSENGIRFSGKVADTPTRATATAFELNDNISVFAFQSETGFAGSAPAYAANVKYTYDDNQFISSGTGISYPADGSSLSFYAIYPYHASADATFTFSVKQDQSIGNNYTLSDLMTASTPLTKDKVPSLRFAHRLSSVVVNLTFEQVPAGTTRLGLSTVLAEANVELSKDRFEGTGNPVQTIWTAANGTNSYKAILPPQNIASGSSFIEIATESGQSYHWITPDEIILQPGTQETINLTVTTTGEVKRTETAGKVLLTGTWKWLTSHSAIEELTHEEEYFIVEEDGSGYEFEGGKLPFRWSVDGEGITIEWYDPDTGSLEQGIVLTVKELTEERLVVEYMEEGVLWTEVLERYNEKALAVTGYPLLISGSRAVCSFQYVLINGSVSLREYGICYSATHQLPTLADSKAPGVPTAEEGTYEADLNYLAPNTTYYFRTYVGVNNEVVYGESQSFTTNKRLSKMVDDKGVETSFTYQDNKLISCIYENEHFDITWTDKEVRITNQEHTDELSIQLDDRGDAVSGKRLQGGIESFLRFAYANGYLIQIVQANNSWNMTYNGDGNIVSFYYLANDEAGSMHTFTSWGSENKAGIIFPDNNWIDDAALEVAYYAGVLGRPTRYLVDQVVLDGTTTVPISYTMDTEGYPLTITKDGTYKWNLTFGE